TFTHGYVTTALCCPSRTSILTGQYSHDTGVHDNSPPDGGAEVFDDSSTLATWLHDAGYRTGFIGKYLNGYASLSPCIPPGYDEWHVQVQVKYYEYDLNDNGVITHFDSNEADYSGDVMTQRAVDFIHNNPPTQPSFPHLTPDPEGAAAHGDPRVAPPRPVRRPGPLPAAELRRRAPRRPRLGAGAHLGHARLRHLSRQQEVRRLPDRQVPADAARIAAGRRRGRGRHHAGAARHRRGRQDPGGLPGTPRLLLGLAPLDAEAVPLRGGHARPHDHAVPAARDRAAHRRPLRAQPRP